MTNTITFGRAIGFPSTIQTRGNPADAPDLVGPCRREPASDDEVRRVTAGDLARKHGLSVDRAAMLIDRFGCDRETLEGAAQALRTRLD